MIAGRKLLLADDSIAIQKVIDLTFTDEGMEVTTVGDGQDALEKLNQFTPDVVLADVFMPSVGGYELCKFIKEDERFRGVPVMLLVGSFEPFDESEAKRAGADDVVTKPFQSIRDLVGRVGSLVSREAAVRQETVEQYSVLGNDSEETAEQVSAASPDNGQLESADQSNVRVFVEAPTMEPDATVFVEAPVMEVEPEVIPEHTCPPVIDLQTADTRKLEPVQAAPTQELPPVVMPTGRESVVGPAEFSGEGVLELGDIDGFSANEDDFVLDVDLEPVATASAAIEPAAQHVPEAAALVEFDDTQASASEEVSRPALVRVTDDPDETSTAQLSAPPATSDLSPDAIEAISRRVVEQLSDKVVREIAWEVVPELSELMIKRRLDEKR